MSDGFPFEGLVDDMRAEVEARFSKLSRALLGLTSRSELLRIGFEFPSLIELLKFAAAEGSMRLLRFLLDYYNKPLSPMWDDNTVNYLLVSSLSPAKFSSP